MTAPTQRGSASVATQTTGVAPSPKPPPPGALVAPHLAAVEARLLNETSLRRWQFCCWQRLGSGERGGERHESQRQESGGNDWISVHSLFDCGPILPP